MDTTHNKLLLSKEKAHGKKGPYWKLTFQDDNGEFKINLFDEKRGETLVTGTAYEFKTWTNGKFTNLRTDSLVSVVAAGPKPQTATKGESEPKAPDEYRANLDKKILAGQCLNIAGNTVNVGAHDTNEKWADAVLRRADTLFKRCLETDFLSWKNREPTAKEEVVR